MTSEMPLPERFSSCSFTPVTKSVASFSPIVASSKGDWSATSYFLDSSGRSRFLLPLQLACRTKDDVDQILASKCLQPPPKNIKQEKEDKTPPTFSLKLEAQCHAVDGARGNVVTVEGITILSSTVEGNSIVLDTQVVVRSSFKSEKSKPKSGVVKTQLEVTAVLANLAKQQRTIASGLVALELGGGSQPLSGLARNLISSRANQTKLGPLSISLSLMSALSLSAKSVDGTTNGSTMVSLTVKHSNTHVEPVTITNIALHPGHSRQDVLFPRDKSMPGGTVVDMSKHVKWSYAPQTAPELPLVLQSYEAYSVILLIHATDQSKSQTFCSPVSVTAMVGSDEAAASSRRPQAVMTTDAQWTTGRVAIEPSDAFRIEMSLRESSCRVGAPFNVSVRVLNLCEETRDLLLIMPKANDGGGDDEEDELEPPAVSDANGYSFGVWGLSGDAEAFSNDQDLLAMDAAVMLGEVKEQQSVDAEIRFVPLKEGPLHVPNFKLFDKNNGKWYSCAHKLCVVALEDEETRD